MLIRFFLKPQLLLAVMLFLLVVSLVSKAVTLDEAMASGNNEIIDSKSQKSTDSLLDNVERGRSNLAQGELWAIQKQIGDICACFKTSDCRESTHIPNTYKSGYFSREEKRLLKKKKQICTSALKKHTSKDVTTEELKTLTVSAGDNRKALKQLGEEMGKLVNYEFFAVDARARKAAEQQSQARVTKEQRELKEWEAEVDAEQERAWAKDRHSNSDEDFWADIQQTHNTTMRNINTQNNKQQNISKGATTSSNSTGNSGPSNRKNSSNGSVAKSDTVTGPLITACKPINGGLVGSLESGQYCYTTLNKNNRGCDSFHQSERKRGALKHCLSLNYQMVKAGKRSISSRSLEVSGTERLSCECGVSKYGSSLCKATYRYSCREDTSKGGSSNSISK
jgi:hypothetical protein